MTTVILVFAPHAAVVGIVSLTGALLLLLPVLLRGVLAAVARLHARSAGPERQPSRWPSCARRGRGRLRSRATGAVAVFGSVAIQGAHARPPARPGPLSARRQLRRRRVGASLPAEQPARDDPVPGNRTPRARSSCRRRAPCGCIEAAFSTTAIAACG